MWAVFADKDWRGFVVYRCAIAACAIPARSCQTFPIWREDRLPFRADAFNVLNHPSLANPSLTGLNSAGGAITGPINFQNDIPDARFFQLAVKYTF